MNAIIISAITEGNYTNSKMFTCLNAALPVQIATTNCCVLKVEQQKPYIYFCHGHHRGTTEYRAENPLNRHPLGLELKVSRRPTEVPAEVSVCCVAPGAWLCLGLQ